MSPHTATAGARPEFLTNQPPARTVAHQLQQFLQLADRYEQPPPIYIATAYFNQGGWVAVADQLEAHTGRGGEVRLLLGTSPADTPGPNATIVTDRARREAGDLPFDPRTHATTRRLVNWLEQEGVEVRQLTDAFLHGKTFAIPGTGAIVGSSNFTRAGLHTNLELNVGTYQPAAEQGVIHWFEHHWNQAEPMDLAALYEHRLRSHAPQRIFLRMLLELYGDPTLNNPDPDLGNRATAGPTLTPFQRDGVTRALRILDQHHGVLVADCVGLGKTFIAGEIIRHYVHERRQRALVIAPAALRDGPWETYRGQANTDFQVVSYDELASDPRFGGTGARIRDLNPDMISLVVLDEAHAVRNPEARRNRAIRQLLKGTPQKDVVLLTATPVNNTLLDLYNLLSLFIRSDNYFAPKGIRSLHAHFENAQNQDPETLSPDSLFTVLDEVTVKRTRRFIQSQYPTAKIGPPGEEVPVEFPDTQILPVTYRLDADELFEWIVFALGDPDSDDRSGHLTLARYRTAHYLLDNDASDGHAHDRSQQNKAVGLLRSGLLKRFESSAEAFRQTIDKMIDRTTTFLDALDRGQVLITTEAVDSWNSDTDDITDELLDDTHPTDTAPIDHYRHEDLRRDVEDDLTILKSIREHIPDDPTGERSPKLSALIDVLRTIAKEPAGDTRKVVVFTYFADTAEWIHQALERAVSRDNTLACYRDRIGVATGNRTSGGTSHRGRDKSDICERFAPVSSGAVSKDAGPDERAGDYDILIATDVLAEGVNLQQAGQLINYDLPWNPMRVVQRHGRIDRIGSPHKLITMRCFFPDERLDELLRLKATIDRKLKQAAATVGTEGQVLPTDQAPTDGADLTWSDDAATIRSLAEGDKTLLDEVDEDGGALNGEEYRKILLAALNRSPERRQLLSLPDGVGAVRYQSQGPARVSFCVSVTGATQPLFRHAVLTRTGEWTIDPVPTTALLHARSDDTTEGQPLDDQTMRLVHEAWETVHADIETDVENWRDPDLLTADVPRELRWAEAMISATTTGWDPLAHKKTADALRSRYPTWILRPFRQLRKMHRDGKVTDAEARVEIVRLVEEHGLEPTPEAVFLDPNVRDHKITLVAWSATVPHTPDTHTEALPQAA